MAKISAETPHQGAPFDSFAIEQRDLLAIFAQTREREAKICFIALLREEQARERPADEMGDPRTEAGVDERHPEQESGHGDIGAGNGEIGREIKQDDGKGNERAQCGNQKNRIGVDAVAAGIAAVEEAIDVLRDTLIGIVEIAAAQAHAVMGCAVEPMADVEMGQPAAPADDQHRLHDIFEHRSGDIDRRPEQEDREKQRPERFRVLGLDRIEPIAVEEGKTHVDRDLGLVDQDQEGDHGAGEAVFRGAEGRQGPNMRHRRFVGFEKTVGDAGHRADDRHMRNRIDEDGEEADRDRQALRQHVFLQRRRPKAELAQEHADSKQNELDRKDSDEDFEKARDRLRSIGRKSTDEADRSQKQRRRVIGRYAAQPERDQAENSNEKAQNFHVLSQMRAEAVRKTTIDQMRRMQGGTTKL